MSTLIKEKKKKEKRKLINGLDKSVRWSEELSFRANHFVICFWKLSCKCPMVGPGVHTRIPRCGLKIACKCPSPGQHQNCIFQWISCKNHIYGFLITLSKRMKRPTQIALSRKLQLLQKKDHIHLININYRTVN